jgi:L-ascorbate metabolism protein UlaG (beta-lactamase superfamily)
MEITWYGHSCFRLMERGMASVVTDPFDAQAVGYEALKLKADIVTVSHDVPGHNFVKAVKGYAHKIANPGEYEIGGVFITGIATNGRKKGEANGPRNTPYVFDYDGITVAHVGDLREVPSRAQVDALGAVNIALVPVGGGGALNAAKAAEVVSVLEPSIVIPMHYATPASKTPLEPLEKFIKEMGLSAAAPEASLKISASSLPGETHVVVLDYKR